MMWVKKLETHENELGHILFTHCLQVSNFKDVRPTEPFVKKLSIHLSPEWKKTVKNFQQGLEAVKVWLLPMSGRKARK